MACSRSQSYQSHSVEQVEPCQQTMLDIPALTLTSLHEGRQLWAEISWFFSPEVVFDHGVYQNRKQAKTSAKS